MKGKTGKPTALRGGGLARKGVGMALKGGGMARKGTGSNATPGGKKLADGGMSGKALPPRLGGSPNPPSDTPMRGPRGTPGMVRPGFPSRPGVKRPGMSGGKGGPGGAETIKQVGRPGMIGSGTVPPKAMGDITTLPGGAMTRPSPIGSKIPLEYSNPDRINQTYSPAVMKKGGKVSKYAKGGAVKMTAGAGSGSGRLEKVAAHKGAKRVPAANLKSGGKVKGK